MIRIRDIALNFDHNPAALTAAILQRIGVSESELSGFSIARKSIDARKTNRILCIYTIDAQVLDESKVLAGLAEDPSAGLAPETRYQMPEPEKLPELPPVIVGSGPCGLFTALILAQAGFKPILLERGKDVHARVRDVQTFWHTGNLDPESNVPFGEGGAGAFSDGKLTTQIKDRHNRIRKVLEEFVAAGAPGEILHHAKPHIGTDNLVQVVKSIRQTIQSLGGQVLFQTKLTGLTVQNGRVTAAIVNQGESIETDTLVLALGHSARDTFDMLHQQGIPMEAKPFSLGIRIEHPQEMINNVQYGKFAGHPSLGPADYKLVSHCPNGRSAYTFCMCPGGQVIASSSEPEGIVTNGMSVFARNRSKGNSALVVGVGPGDFPDSGPLAGIAFQRHWEQKAFTAGGGGYCAPGQRVDDFLAGRPTVHWGKVAPSYKPEVRPCDLRDCLPDFVVQTLGQAIPLLDNKLRGFALPDAVMTGVESRSSSPLRIVRDQTCQCPTVRGLYPAGEGAGYAGGIVSSAVDGIRIAEAICNSNR